MTDRNLEEAIFQLQKLNTENGVKKLADEAAQLLANGRQIEASALMEKAEAMIAAKSAKPVPAFNHQSSTPVTPQEKPKVEERAKVDEQVMTNMAGKLADGLSKILMGAFQELERHIVGESRKISTSIEQQLGRLQATVDTFTQLQAKFEHLTETVSEQRSTGTSMVQKYEQISTSVTALEEVSARHEKEIGAIRTESTAVRGEATALRAETGALRGETNALRNEAKDFSTVITHQMDGLSARVGLHQEELGGLKSTVSDISRKVSGFIERIDRQGEVLRALNDTQVRRAAALDEVLGVLTRLKAPAESLVAAAAAGQM
jgi:chromosome segregation ATPase